MININEIKSKYNNPVVAHKPPAGSYCVGGAFCRYFKETSKLPDSSFPVCKDFQDFPDIEELSSVLKLANPELSEGMAMLSAAEIIEHNDNCSFGAAWDILSSALNYKAELSKNHH